ncbi:MAG TPA: hypothetical protein VLS94_10295, partial [Fusibacter sp.]|nr:hypothetical protein [Fusibacter sp.]
TVVNNDYQFQYRTIIAYYLYFVNHQNGIQEQKKPTKLSLLVGVIRLFVPSLLAQHLFSR